jgi:hypothetical protein
MAFLTLVEGDALRGGLIDTKRTHVSSPASYGSTA